MKQPKQAQSVSVNNIYRLDGRVPIGAAIPFGLQHILAMFVANLAPITIIAGAGGLDTASIAILLQNAMFVAGIATLIQLYPVWKIGSRLPVVMGVSFTFVAVLSTVAANYGYPSVVGAVLGTILGLLAGYYGGWIEMLVMRGADVLFSFPDILLAIAIVALLGPGIINVFIAVAVFTVPSFARMMRSATLAVKGSLYVEVSRSLGCKDGRILFLHIFPGTIQSLIVNFTMRIGSAIMAASSLSFLGFGANVTDPEWGAMLSMSRSYLSTAPHMVYLPGLVIFVTVLAFNLFGDGLRDTLDPKIK